MSLTSFASVWDFLGRPLLHSLLRSVYQWGVQPFQWIVLLEFFWSALQALGAKYHWWAWEEGVYQQKAPPCWVWLFHKKSYSTLTHVGVDHLKADLELRGEGGVVVIWLRMKWLCVEWHIVYRSRPHNELCTRCWSWINSIGIGQRQLTTYKAYPQTTHYRTAMHMLGI